MILYPAIDLKGGEAVRLLHGDMDKATTYYSDPSEPAQRFAEAGCEWLHLVDLDGAIAGHAANAEAVSAILAAISIPVQLGGGIRDLNGIERWLQQGVARIILGTIAAEQPELVAEAAKNWPGKIAVGIDARLGKVSIRGWTKDLELSPIDAAKRFEDAGVSTIIYTDIGRDGAMSGPNIEATEALASAVEIPVIASGGVSSIEDLERLKQGGKTAGAITGRALYDGAIDLSEALKILAR